MNYGDGGGGGGGVIDSSETGCPAPSQLDGSTTVEKIIPVFGSMRVALGPVRHACKRKLKFCTTAEPQRRQLPADFPLPNSQMLRSSNPE